MERQGDSGSEEARPDIGPVPALVRARGAPLIDGLDRRTPGAREHAEATGTYAFAAAIELGHSRGSAELIREAAKLHEIGEVYLDRSLLAEPPESLGADQRARLAEHHESGSRLARGAGVPEEVCNWILGAGERYDGQGPKGLAADAIPIESRIVRAACACDRTVSAPTSGDEADRLARRRRAVTELRAASGRELDPDVVDAMAAVLERAVPA